MIYYLLVDCQLNVNNKDVKGNTALHWAVYIGAENSVFFLLAAEKIELESQDD